MPLNPDAVGSKSDPVEASWTSKDALLYAVGIGAGEHCDGQILVLHDMLGLSDTDYTFVKRYEKFGERLDRAARDYAREVREGAFPAAEHRFESSAGGGRMSRSKRSVS